MKLIGTSVFAGFLSMAVMAYGGTLVIDNFTCSDSVTQTGVGSTNSAIVCPGSLGGSRLDGIFLPGGSGSAQSTINSNPPADAITGTIGTGLSGGDVMVWSGSTTLGVWNLPDLNFSGDSVLVEIKSDSSGSVNVNLGSGSTSSNNVLNYSAVFGPSTTYENLLIPLTNPTIIGAGASVDSVTAIGMMIQVPGGGSWTIAGVEVVPEPSMTWLLGAFMAVAFVVFRRGHLRSGRD